MGEASTRSTRGMESIRDIEDDAGPVFKRSRLAGAAIYIWYQVQYSGYKLTVTTNFT